jgi:ankyrin repeat protein
MGCIPNSNNVSTGSGSITLNLTNEIHDAAESGDLAKVKALVKEHPDLVFSRDSDGATPLHLAADKGRRDVAELLLANKADVNARDTLLGFSPLHSAAVNGQ